MQRDVNEAVFLVPFLGEQNPPKVRDVVNYIRQMLLHPPPFDGIERDVHEPRESAANGVVVQRPPRPVRAQHLSLEDPYFFLMPDLTVSMVSDGLQQVLGVKLQEFRRHWTERIDAADTDLLQHNFEHARVTHEGFSERVHWRLRDGASLGSTLRVIPRVLHDRFRGFTGHVLFDHVA